jgi:hypothetical protein
VRHGTADLFAALDVASGRVIAETAPPARSVEVPRFLDTIDAAVPPELDVHLVSTTRRAQDHADPALAA